MRVLLDECLPGRFGRLITGHEVVTVSEAGWAGKSNGQLLSLAAVEFDAFLTVDQNIPAQQRLDRLAIGVVVLSARTNRVQDLEPLLPELLDALRTIGPGRLVRLGV